MKISQTAAAGAAAKQSVEVKLLARLGRASVSASALARRGVQRTHRNWIVISRRDRLPSERSSECVCVVGQYSPQQSYKYIHQIITAMSLQTGLTKRITYRLAQPICRSCNFPSLIGDTEEGSWPRWFGGSTFGVRHHGFAAERLREVHTYKGMVSQAESVIQYQVTHHTYLAPSHPRAENPTARAQHPDARRPEHIAARRATHALHGQSEVRAHQFRCDVKIEGPWPVRSAPNGISCGGAGSCPGTRVGESR